MGTCMVSDIQWGACKGERGACHGLVVFLCKYVTFGHSSVSQSSVGEGVSEWISSAQTMSGQPAGAAIHPPIRR